LDLLLARRRRLDVRRARRASRLLRLRQRLFLRDEVAQLRLRLGAALFLRLREALVLFEHLAEARLELFAAVLFVAASRVLVVGAASKRLLGVSGAAVFSRAAIRLRARAVRHGRLPGGAARGFIVAVLREVLLRVLDRVVRLFASEILRRDGSPLLLLGSSNLELRLSAARLFLGSDRRLVALRRVRGERAEPLNLGRERRAAAFFGLQHDSLRGERAFNLRDGDAAAIVLLSSLRHLRALHRDERRLRVVPYKAMSGWS
jgi:hypothetical protein